MEPRDIKANADMIEGFRDGYDLSCPEPSANRSASYRHGFANGRDDVLHKRPRDTYENLCAAAEAAMAEDACR